MRTCIISGLIFLLISCTEKQTRSTNEADSLASVADCHAWLSDSVLATGDFVKYASENGRVKIEWGNDNFRRTLETDYSCKAAPSWIPTIRWSTSQYIGLRYGCGSPCWGTIILPLNSTESVIERTYDVGRQADRNLIVYLSGKDYDRLTIENWITGAKQELKPNMHCASAFLGYCIDSLRFGNDTLYFAWDDSAGERSPSKRKFDPIQLELNLR